MMKAKTAPAFTGTKLVLVGVLLCITCFLPRTAYAETTTTTNPEYTAALEELDRITATYGALAEEQDATLSELEAVRKKIDSNETEIAGVKKDVAASKDKIAQKQDNLAEFVSEDYKSGGVSLLSIVLSSSSFEDLFSRIYYHSVICDAEATEIDEMNAARKELEGQQAKLEKLEDDLKQQEEDLESLYGAQREQTEAMFAQQLAATELVNSLPAEIQTTIEDETEELITDAEPVDEGTAEETQEEATTTEQDEAATEETTTKTETDDSTSQQEEAKKTTTESEKTTTETTKKDTSSSSKSDTSTKTTTTKKTTTTTTTTTKTKQGSTGTQQAVLNAAYSTSGTEALNNGWGCAGWVYTVFRNSGVYNKKPTCAAWYYNNWCYSSDRSDLQPGMVIAISTWTGTAAGKRYGHVGIYVGNNTVRHLSAGAVRETTVDKWIRTYGTTVTPRWGWNGGIVLS